MEITVVVLAGTETHGDLGRLANALETAAEAAAAGAELELVFDGAAARWIARLEDPDHKYHAVWRGLKPRSGVCVYCARAFGVLAEVRSAGVRLLDERRGHPSLYGRLARGSHVLTF